MYTLEEKLDIIEKSTSFDDLKISGILPEPDVDEGYYFVSYSHKDYKLVLTDILKLQESGVKIWYDRGLETGTSWLEDVCRKIDSFYCKGVIVYYGKNLKNSAACKKELNQANLSNKSSLIITLDDEQFEEELTVTAALNYSDDVDLKLAAIKSLPKPELYDVVIKKHLLLGKFAIVTGINDKNIDKLEIPRHLNYNGKRYPVRAIGIQAFVNCPNLKEVTLPDGWAIIMNEAFLNCFRLEKVNFGSPFRILRAFYMGGVFNAFTNCISLKDLSQLKCEKPLKGVGSIIFNSAFKNCTSLRKVDLQGNYMFSGACFSGCDNIEYVKFNKRQCSSQEMFAYNENLKEVEYAPDCIETVVSEKAYYNCTGLSKITLPDRVKSIDDSAFFNCTGLTKINIPPKTKRILSHAFANCTGISEIRIPKKMDLLIDNAFEGDVNLKTVFVDSVKMRLVRSDFANNTPAALEEVFAYADVFYLRKGCKYMLSNDFEIVPSDEKNYIKYGRKNA